MKLLAAFLVALLAWAAGLAAFADRVGRLTPADPPEAADGIVALTGHSDQRLRAAARLLEAGMGKRLLISGVNRQARRSDVQALTGVTKSAFDCCVDLGFTAADTIGNAQEAAEWARSMRYGSLILVTADYHMPRAMLELRASAPALDIQAYPVATPELNAHRWTASTASAKRMVVEYCKYLAILAREAALGGGGGRA